MVAPPCFFRGTRIATPNGEVPVEELRIGDEVLTSSGASTPIKFIGIRRLTNDMDRWPESVEPIVIQPGALGPDSPSRELRLSPDHALYLDGMLFTARELVDGHPIAPLGQTSIHRIEYYHVDLGVHDLVYAEGAATESYNGQRRDGFDNHDEFLRRYGPIDETPYAPFAPKAYRLRTATSEWGASVGHRLPEPLQYIARPVAHRTYRAVDLLERLWSRTRSRMPLPDAAMSPREAVLKRIHGRR